LFLYSICFFQAEDCIRDFHVTGVQTCALPIFPTKDNHVKATMPGAILTFIVALGLLSFGLVVFLNVVELDFKSSVWLDIIYKYGLWTIASIFILRAIGEFNYVGFFKKYKRTKFGQKDTKYYSPLCLIIGLLIIVLELIK